MKKTHILLGNCLIFAISAIIAYIIIMFSHQLLMITDGRDDTRNLDFVGFIITAVLFVVFARLRYNYCDLMQYNDIMTSNQLSTLQKEFF